MTEREKMALGLWYDANFDPELCAQRDEAAARCLAFNNADPRDAAEKARLQKLLLPNAAERQDHHWGKLLHRPQLRDVHRQPPPLLRRAEPRL